MAATVATNKKAATGGTVTFFDGKLSLGSAQVVGKKPAKGYKTGMAILTTIVSPGSHAVTAVYGGTAGLAEGGAIQTRSAEGNWKNRQHHRAYG